ERVVARFIYNPIQENTARAFLPVLELLTDPGAEVRRSVASALIVASPASLDIALAPELTDLLYCRTALHSSNRSDQLRAAMALTRHGQEGLRLLGEVIGTSIDPRVRLAVCVALARIGPTSFVFLLAGTEDPDPDVRLVAFRNLQHISDTSTGIFLRA